MVDFENICVENGVLTADAVNARYGIKEHITAKIDGSYHSSSDNEIVKATWGVILEARKKKKYPSKTTIAWY